MKKSLFALLTIATFALTFTSCKKDKDEDKKVELTNNSFAVDGVKIDGDATIGALFTSNILALSSKDGKSTVAILFKAKPEASGTFNLKGILQLKDLGDKDLILTVTTNGKTYISNPSNTEKASITVTDGKLSVAIPKVTLSEDKGTTITFEAKILEY